MEEIKDKLRDKKLLKQIIIYLIIFLVIIFVLNWLIKSMQIGRNKNKAENFNEYYRKLLVKCDNQDKKAYDCCFNSVAQMAANNYKIAGIGCKPGFKLNAFNCQGTYKWCEMIR